jgi:hypothetical protein
MKQMVVARHHRADSWTRALLGEVLWVEDLPTTELAGVAQSPYENDLVYGYDVIMERLTITQLNKLWEFTGGLIAGSLFLPVECAEPPSGYLA